MVKGENPEPWDLWNIRMCYSIFFFFRCSTKFEFLKFVAKRISVTGYNVSCNDENACLDIIKQQCETCQVETDIIHGRCVMAEFLCFNWLICIRCIFCKCTSEGQTSALWLSGSDRGCRRGPRMPCSQVAGSYHLAVQGAYWPGDGSIIFLWQRFFTHFCPPPPFSIDFKVCRN
jgi:hypothetical protein